MSSFEFENKVYNVIDDVTENAFLTIGILSFNYYPKEKLFIATKSFSDFFKCPRVLKDMPDSLSNLLIHIDDHSIITELANQIDKGNKKVSASLRTKEGFFSNVTVTAIEVDDNDQIKNTFGIVQKIETDVRQTRAPDALSSDFTSIYYVDLEKNAVFPHRLSDDIERKYGIALRLHPPYEQIVQKYISENVLEIERKEMEYICSIDNLRNQFKDKKMFIHDYRIERNNEIRFCRMKIVNLSDSDDFKYFAVGFSDMSSERTVDLEQYAFVDSITGGNNYNGFKKKVRAINLPGFLINMDINKFKIINTLYGITRADSILKDIGDLCNSFCTGNALCGHVNADVFSMYFPEISQDEVLWKIKMLTENLSSLSSKLGIPKLQPCFGIAKWTLNDELESSFGEAIIAKNQAKKQNLNFLFYTEEEKQKIMFDKYLEDTFEADLKAGKIEVWYQSKINPKSGCIVGAEALTRWRMKDDRLLSPGLFIPLFESNGLIRKIDEYVFTSVCKLQKKLLDSGENIVPVSLNLSRVSIFFGNIVSKYAQIARDIGIDPKYVPIEITESAAVANDDVLRIMKEFHDEGFLIYIDDFGTGYSSLSTLSSFQFDTVKIDKSLVDAIGENRGDILLKHVFNLSNDLGISLTAEGVENEDQVAFLKNLNCNSIQGYFYSKPVTLSDFLNRYFPNSGRNIS